MDTVHRFILDDLDIRGALVQLGPAWESMHKTRGYATPVRNLLGELAAITTLIGCDIKSPSRLTFQLQGLGPISLLVMDCDEQLRLRGMARSQLSDQATSATTDTSLGYLLGDGQLGMSVQDTTENASSKSYQSVVPLKGDTLASTFEYYMLQSAQKPTRIWLAASDDSACGLFLQKLPNADILDPDGWNRIEKLASTIRPEELRLPPTTLLTRLFGGEKVMLLYPRPVIWHCPRNEERVRNMLLAMGRDEVEAILADAEGISVADEICGHEYRFGPELLDELFPPEGRLLH